MTLDDVDDFLEELLALPPDNDVVFLEEVDAPEIIVIRRGTKRPSDGEDSQAKH